MPLHNDDQGTDAADLIFLRELYVQLYTDTGSWELCDVGVHLAYLTHAILHKTKCAYPSNTWLVTHLRAADNEICARALQYIHVLPAEC